MIIREGQRKVIMPDRIGGRERDRGILCVDEETETATPGAPAQPRKTANPRNYLEVSCFRLSRTFETSGINSVPYYRFYVNGVNGTTCQSREIASRSIDPRGSISKTLLCQTVPLDSKYEQMCRLVCWSQLSMQIYFPQSYKCVENTFVRNIIWLDAMIIPLEVERLES